MKPFHPDSIAGRTLVVLLVGLTLSHIGSMALMSTDHHDSSMTAAERLCAERGAVAARLLERAPPEARSALAVDLSSPTMAVAWAAAPVLASGDDDPHAGHLAMAMATDFGVVDGDRLRVAHRLVDSGGRNFVDNLLDGFPKDRMMAVSFRLSDGSWANFDMEMAQGASLWTRHVVLSTLTMMAAILVIGALATGWIGRPLAAFAKAADRLGRDVAAPPMDGGGPREVREAVTAFNEMQNRIRRFVEDRTRLLAAISHDLRSPITRLRLRAEMLDEGEGRARMLADLGEMEAMVTSTLDFARADAADEPTQAIDLAALLQAVCDDATDIGLAAAYRWDGRLVATCRPAALKRALTNLVENAARYGGGAHVASRRAGRDLVVTVDDDGPGIPEAELEAVFAPFTRLESSRNRRSGGIGLGLAVARTVVRAHGGDIALANRPEGGLRATVTLPQEEGA